MYQRLCTRQILPVQAWNCFWSKQFHLQVVENKYSVPDLQVGPVFRDPARPIFSLHLSQCSSSWMHKYMYELATANSAFVRP